MAYKLGVLVVHGMGSQKPDFAEPMKRGLEKCIAARGVDPAGIYWEPVFWAKLLGDKQQKLWRRLSRNRRFRYRKIREFVVAAMGDAVAYQQSPTRPRSVYTDIHNLVLAHLRKMRRRLGNADLPLVILAHSLGSVIVSDYIWDRQKKYKPRLYGRTALERMETLALLITFGSTLPLFSMAYYPVVSIAFPPPGVRRFFPPGTTAAEIRRVAKWLNYYDRDDVMGYPLKPTSPSYNKNVTRDRQVNVGGIFSSWNPLSHTAYWTDKDFCKPVGKAITDVMKLL
ncbi:MAG: hypothetical protein V3V49_06645 [Candidatus Krumholzibacteria bacterium]